MTPHNPILPSAIRRAAKLAETMTADPVTTPPGDRGWTTQDVLNLAVERGLELLEQRYLPSEAAGDTGDTGDEDDPPPPCPECGTGQPFHTAACSWRRVSDTLNARAGGAA